jgi:short-subunit dehydrogenase
MNKTAFITGATGSIGQALAIKYASLNFNLVLHGRNEEKLHAVVEQCQAFGVDVQPCVIDLSDSAQTIHETQKLLKESVPDIFIANAGININIGTEKSGEKLEELEALMDINIKSTLLMSNLMAKAMHQQGHGQIVLISSLAAFFGLPITPGYSASKAAIKSYGEALRGWLAKSGVGVTVVMPGYIKSDMSDEMPGPKPFLLSPDRAAEIIIRGVRRNRPRVSFPFPLNLGTWFLGILPPSISLWILKLLNYS